MTDNEIRIAMAEVDGWTLEDTGQGVCWHENGIMSEIAPPIYQEDLNAVHEVEKKIKEFGTYFQTLNMITCGSPKADLRGLILATPLQRCEAILRTFGKWKD